MKTLDDDRLYQWKYLRLPIDLISFRIMKPIITVVIVGIDPVHQLFIMKIEGISVKKDLMHDDPQRKHIVFVCIPLTSFIVFWSAVRNRKARLMIT
jgi:hypothetical protein